MTTDGNIFRCPACGKPVSAPSYPLFPFCSDRCRLIDLSNWIEEKYTVARPLEPDEEPDVAGPAGSSPQG